MTDKKSERKMPLAEVDEAWLHAWVENGDITRADYDQERQRRKNGPLEIIKPASPAKDWRVTRR